MARLRSIALALVLLAAAGAIAQQTPAAPPASSDGEQVRAAYQKGKAEYDLGNYAEALNQFEEVYRRRPQLTGLLFNIGQCHRFLGNLEKAATTFRAFLRNAAPNDRNAEQARELLAEVEKSIAQKEHLKTVSPQGLAGGSESASPAVAPSPATTSPPAAPSPATTSPAAASAPAVATLRSPPPAAPPAGAPSNSGSAPANGKVAVVTTAPSSSGSTPPIAQAPREATLSREPAPEGRTRIVTWIAAGGAVVALGAGSYFGLQSKSLASNLQSSPHPRAQVDSDSATAKSDATKGTVLLAAGAALAAAAGVLFVLRF